MAKRAAKSTSESWQTTISTWEKTFNSMANATMAGDEYSGVMNQAMKLTLLMQQSLGQVMAVYLSTMNLPSKTDVAALGERLLAVESRLDRMTALLELLLDPDRAKTSATPSGHLAAPAAPAPARSGSAIPMPPRTKTPPASARRAKK